MAIDLGHSPIGGGRITGDVRQAVQRSKVDMDPDKPYGAPIAGVDFLPAPDLERIADHLIDECKELEHLVDLRDEGKLAYLWKQKGGSAGGKAKLGTCTKASGLVGHYSQAIWVIWLAADWCNIFPLTRRQVEAALYHELLHAGQKEDDNGIAIPKVEPHDCEMFGAEVRRYGLWKEDLKLIARAFETQLPLFEREG